MVSRDVIGSPPNHIMKMQLQKLWASILGAVDVKDFDTWIKEAADLTYQEAKERLIKEYGSPDLESRYKELEERAERAAESGKEEYIEDELKNMGEMGEAAVDHIRDLKLQLEETKRKLAEKERRKPKTKTIKAQPLSQEKPESKLQHTPVPPPLPEKHGADFDWLYKVVSEDGMSDLGLVENEVGSKHIDLTENDKKFLLDIIEQKKKEIEDKYAKIDIRKVAAPEGKARKEKKVRTVDEIMKRKIEEKKEEELKPFRAVEMIYPSINLNNARLFFRDYQRYIPEMLRIGIKAWLETHRSVYVFPITTRNIEALAMALEYAVSPAKASIREATAKEFMQRYAYIILMQGLEMASKSFDWQVKYDYYKEGLKEKLPDLSTFRRDVIEEMRKIKYEF